MVGSSALDVTDATFTAAVLERSKTTPVVVDFWAPWCGPCRVLGPVIERVAAEHPNDVLLAKVNTDENPRTATAFKIQSIPAVKAFKNGKVFSEFVGALPEPQVRQFFGRLVPSPGERAVREAQELVRRDPKAAEARFREALAKGAPPDAVVGLAELLIGRGEDEEAAALLERAPADRRARTLKHRLFLDGFVARNDPDVVLSEAEKQPRDPRAQYRRGLVLAARMDYAAALDALLESVRLEKAFADGAARKAVLAVFDILGPDDELTRDGQRRLSMLLF